MNWRRVAVSATRSQPEQKFERKPQLERLIGVFIIVL
jgi:hypothetical protein